jgi:hypothetical protein
MGTSVDGQNWTPRTSGVSTTINDIAYANGIHISCGASGYIARAANTQSINYSAGYNVEADFLVPPLSALGTFANSGIITANGSLLTSQQANFVKVRM